jgi:hypothetical protein
MPLALVPSDDVFGRFGLAALPHLMNLFVSLPVKRDSVPQRIYMGEYIKGGGIACMPPLFNGYVLAGTAYI